MALTRPNTSIHTTGSLGIIGCPSSVDHLGHLLDDGGRELYHALDHPRQQQQQHRDDPQRFGHKGQRLLVDGRHGLEQADRQANDHRRQEKRRRQRHGLEDHHLQYFSSESGIHFFTSGYETLNERPHDQRPAVHQHEQQQLQRKRNGHRGHHHHPHAHQHGR